MRGELKFMGWAWELGVVVALEKDFRILGSQKILEDCF